MVFKNEFNVNNMSLINVSCFFFVCKVIKVNYDFLGFW